MSWIAESLTDLQKSAVAPGKKVLAQVVYSTLGRQTIFASTRAHEALQIRSQHYIFGKSPLVNVVNSTETWDWLGIGSRHCPD